MDPFKFSVLREKWRLYFVEGQRDVFDTCSSEEAVAKRSTLKHNKAYVELLKMTPITDSNDSNITPPNIALSPQSDEIGVTTAVTSGVHDFPAAEHMLEHSDIPNLQLHEMASDDTTVKCEQEYEHITYANELEPMLEQSDSELAINADISQLQGHHVLLMNEFAQRHEHIIVHEMEPVLEQFDSNEIRPHVREDQPQMQPRVNFAQGICLGDLLRPEFAELRERRLAQSQECESDQLFESPMRMSRQPDLLKTKRKLYKLEDLVGPITPVVEYNHRSKFAQKVERMFREIQIEVRNDTNSQLDLLQMQNNCEVPRITTRDILSLWKPYLVLPFMHRHAHYKMILQPILEEEEPETIQEPVLPELEQQLHIVEQKSDLETYQEEPQEIESDDSHNEDYEDALSTDEEQSMIEAFLNYSTAGEQLQYHNRNLLFIVLICVAIYLRTMEGDILEDLLKYASFEDIIVFMFIFFSLLCFCKIYDYVMYGEGETIDSVNDPTDNDPPVEDVDVQPSRRVTLHGLDQMRADPQADRNIEPVMDAPNALQPMPSEQDMERE